MADVIRKTTNRFSKGLIMDFSPENTRNEVLTHALNATLLTFNGNELSLQNDMGNARVETAYLPEGYMPVGTCEYGGIIYIVSYNPLENKSQIGCFPSPERNISSSELGKSEVIIDKDYFQEDGKVLHNTQYVLLKDDNLNPGDKFLVCADSKIYDEQLADLWIKNESSEFELIKNPIIALNVVSIEDSGKIVYLNSDIRKYEVPTKDEVYYNYHILGKTVESGQAFKLEDVDLTSYRNVLSSGYSVFKSKTSGKLAILAELIMIDSYSVTHRLIPKENNGEFDVVISTEVSPELTETNYFIEPKLKYYYLENSQGYLQTSEGNTELFISNKVNPNFNKTSLENIYIPIDKSLNLKQSLEDTGVFNFPYADTYHSNIKPYFPESLPKDMSEVYTRFSTGYSRILKSQILDDIDYYEFTIRAKFYYYNNKGEQYTEYTNTTVNTSYTYFIKSLVPIYTDAKRDISNKGKSLWKIQSIKLVATDKEKRDTTIEKWFEKIVYGYALATPEQISEGIGLLIKTDDNKYETVGEVKEGETYYVKTEGEPTLVSLGKTNQESNKNTLYYYPEDSEIYVKAEEEDLAKYWDFDSYPLDTEAPWGCPVTLYLMEYEDKWVSITHEEVTKYQELNLKIYYDTRYVWISDISNYDIDKYQLFMTVPEETYIDSKKFKPSKEYNYIAGVTTQEELNNPEGDPDKYPDENPIYLYTIPEFIPSNEKGQQNYLSYDDVILANIKIPEVVVNNELDLPFKYDYTIVPCMNYGRLSHLAISNTVDFSKLHAFNQSNFNTWKYYIDENQLRLTFGAAVYDTYETDKVDGLVLEFYDCWGFAGSIEITDKKSYSGIFTKTIPLNTLGAISTRQIDIENNTYKSPYARNINIQKQEEKYLFNGKELREGPDWKYIDKEYNFLDDSDCGTLYSNILYGVKTYLRKTDNKGNLIFIPKKDLVLYTLPFYNEYYYNINDFSVLPAPKLELVLTYKLEDTSVKNNYTGGGIINGYNTNDLDKVNSYLSGNYEGEDPFNIVKYYLYNGISNLYLEVGLNKDYDSLNLKYDTTINDNFSCTLKLISDANPDLTFTVNPDNALNYTEEMSPKNTLTIEGLNSIEIDSNTFKKSNFLYNTNAEPLKIEYEFVVGYKANISDIRKTQVPATTVCALCHKDVNGLYNYEDFGVYEQDSSLLLSNMMFYNEGDSTTEIFGLCRLVNTTGNASQQCQSITSTQNEARKSTVPGKFNTGDALKSLVPSIGKLTFCQPHAHIISEGYGVNIYHTSDDDDLIDEFSDPRYYGISSDGRQTGTVPTALIFNEPKYNLVLNTQNSIKYNSEFISTLEYGTKTGREYHTPEAPGENGHLMRIFSGFTGELLSTFNLKMIETMKNVYAYNPDYDQLTVNVGNVTLQDYNPSFTSNLVSIDSKFVGNLNEFIYLGHIKFSDYLDLLLSYINPNMDTSLLKLTPDYTYCGLPDSYYLISLLTYNTPVPKELEEELEFTSNITVIKTSEGNNILLTGTPDKKALYGLLNNKMILLDVTNYKIDETGKLTVRNLVIEDSQEKTISSSEIIKNNLEFNITFNDDTISGILSFITSQESYLRYENKHLYILFRYNGLDGGEKRLAISPILDVPSLYSTTIIDCFKDFQYQVLYAYELPEDVNLILILYEDYNTTDLDELLNGPSNLIVGGQVIDSKYIDGGSIQFTTTGNGVSRQLALLLKISFSEEIKFIINKLSEYSESFVSSYRTKKYSQISNNKYEVLYKDSRLKGSNITLNDLIYEPNLEGHRLFMRNNLCVYDPTLRGELYYRTTIKEEGGEEFKDWNANTKGFNTLFIHTGPCFTKSNL